MSHPDDPLGRRSLFGPSPEDRAKARPRPADEQTAGRQAFFSVPPFSASSLSASSAEESATDPIQPTGRSGPAVVVDCRRCRARTSVPLLRLGRQMLPSVWRPLSRWSTWMRCPSCGKYAWCRVEWRRLVR